MAHEVASISPETVPLKNAVLCVDCELVTTSRRDVCPVCGGHSLLALAPIMGGTVVDYRTSRYQREQLFLFDLHISIDMAQLQAEELTAVIEGLSRVVAPKLRGDGASLHLSVEPVAMHAPLAKIAA
jgi:hypothetical protein